MRERSQPPPPLLAVAAQVPLPPSPKPFSHFFNSSISRTPQEVPLPPSPSLFFPSSNASSSSSVDCRSSYSDERNYPPSHFSPPNSPEPKLAALRRRLTSLSFNPRSNASREVADASSSSDDLLASLPQAPHRISRPLLRQQQRPPLSPSAFSFNHPRSRPPLPPSPLVTSYAPSPQRSQLNGKNRHKKRFWNGRGGAGDQQSAVPRKLGEALNGLLKRAKSGVGKREKGVVNRSERMDPALESVRWTREVTVEQESQLREAVKELFGAESAAQRRDGPQSTWLHGRDSIDVKVDGVVDSPTTRIRHHPSASLSPRQDVSSAQPSPIRRVPSPVLPHPSLGASFEMDGFGALFGTKVDDGGSGIHSRRSIRQVASATVISPHKESRSTARRPLSSPALRVSSTSTTPRNLDPPPSLPHYPNSPRPRRLFDLERSHSFVEHQTDAYVDGGWDTGTPTKRRQAGEGETIRIRIIEPTPPWLKSFKETEEEGAQSRVQMLAKDAGAGGAGDVKTKTSFELHQASELWLAQQEQLDRTSATVDVEIEEEEESAITDSPLRHRTRLSASLSDHSNLSNLANYHPLPLPPFPPPPVPAHLPAPTAGDFSNNQNAPIPPPNNRRVRHDASPSLTTLGKRVDSTGDDSVSYTESEGSVDHESKQKEIIDEMDRLLDEMGGVSDEEEQGDEVVWEGSRFEDAEEDAEAEDEGYGLDEHSLAYSPTFGHGFSTFLLASTSASDPFNDPPSVDEFIPFPTLLADQRQSRIASRRGRSPLPHLDLPPREPTDVEIAPSGYHSEQSEAREQVGNWAFEDAEQEEQTQEWTPTPESEEKTPRLPFPTVSSHATDHAFPDPSFPSSSTPRRLATLSAFSPSASFPSPSSIYSNPSPPRPRPRTQSTPSLLLGPFSPPARQPSSSSPSHHFTPPKASASLAQSPGSVLVTSGGPDSEDWRLSPVLVGGRETLRRLGSERG